MNESCVRCYDSSNNVASAATSAHAAADGVVVATAPPLDVVTARFASTTHKKLAAFEAIVLLAIAVVVSF